MFVTNENQSNCFTAHLNFDIILVVRAGAPPYFLNLVSQIVHLLLKALLFLLQALNFNLLCRPLKLLHQS